MGVPLEGPSSDWQARVKFDIPSELTPSTHLDTFIGVVIACYGGSSSDFTRHQSSFNRKDWLAQQSENPERGLLLDVTNLDTPASKNPTWHRPCPYV